MKILFIGVFDVTRQSTNTSQLLSFKRLDHEIVGYNYRQKALHIGEMERDKELVSVVEKGDYDLVIYSKCNRVSEQAFKEINKHTKTCLWFMDPLVSYNEEMKAKTALVDYFCCDKQNVLEEAKNINSNSFYVCEGFDPDVDRPIERSKEYNVGFIGTLYGNRPAILQQVNHKVNVVSNAYGVAHAEEVAKTKINLNFCTEAGASDRVYKILGAKGFLLTDDWRNREAQLIDGKDCVIFKDLEDLNEKIEFYLRNEEARERIAAQGCETIQQFTRLNWAKKIIALAENIK